MSKFKRRKLAAFKAKPRCGLCGQYTKPLTRTECCDNWICDDSADYIVFSFARNSCHRNHQKYTICSAHYNEKHDGMWQNCPKCREMDATEMYVYYATNEYNFVKLQNPPEFEPTYCQSCDALIILGEGGFTQTTGECFCEKCSQVKLGELSKLMKF